jgi:hypothetical protein
MSSMRLRDLSTKQRLSNISRRLKEDQSLIKTEDRLSRNLDDEDFTDPITFKNFKKGVYYNPYFRLLYCCGIISLKRILCGKKGDCWAV